MRVNRFSYVAILLLLSAGLQLWLPIFGDEALFVSWGINPAFGYYDHPPSIGWLSAPLIWLENRLGILPHGILHRVAMLLLAVLMLWGLKAPLKRLFPSQSIVDVLLAIAALPVFLIAFNSFYNDTILVVFLLVFFVASYQSFSESRFRLLPILIAGAAFGLGLQTKYSVGIFYIGLVLFLLVSAKGRQFLFGRFVLISLVAGMLFLPNVFWNLNNCSVNFAFNFAFRPVQPSIFGAVNFAVIGLILLGPTLFFLVKACFDQRKIGFFSGVFLSIAGVSLLYSISRGAFGLNWGAPFMVLALLAVAEVCSQDQVRRLMRWNLGYTLVLMLPIIAILALDHSGLRPFERFLPAKAVAVFNLESDLADGSLTRKLETLADETDSWVATSIYGQTAVLQNYGLDRAVQFSNSIYGRNFDLSFDYNVLDGKDVIYLSEDPTADAVFVAKMFDAFETVTLAGNRQQYVVYIGRGFRFETYRTEMILPFMAKYYDNSPFPAFACFMDKYR